MLVRIFVLSTLMFATTITWAAGGVVESPTGVAPDRYVYYPGTEALGPARVLSIRYQSWTVSTRTSTRNSVPTSNSRRVRRNNSTTNRDKEIRLRKKTENLATVRPSGRGFLNLVALFPCEQSDALPNQFAPPFPGNLREHRCFPSVIADEQHGSHI